MKDSFTPPTQTGKEVGTVPISLAPPGEADGVIPASRVFGPTCDLGGAVDRGPRSDKKKIALLAQLAIEEMIVIGEITHRSLAGTGRENLPKNREPTHIS